MLSYLMPMISALSLTLTAGSLPGWSRLTTMYEQRCTAAHDHWGEAGQPAQRATVKKQRQVQEIRVLSFGP